MRRGGPGWLSVLVIGLTAHVAGSASAQSGDAGTAFFEKAIRPVLVEHCYQCHSAEAARKGKLKAGLALDTRQGLLTGGESGPAIIPGDADKSLLIKALQHEMPPSGRLPAEVIDRFAKWVALGAPDSRTEAAPMPRREAFR